MTVTPHRWNSFTRYLSAKKSVDDRALNQQVWQTTRDNLPHKNPLRILEVGGGIGTMVERIATWELPAKNIHYTLLDSNPNNIVAAKTRLAQANLPSHFHIEFVTADVLNFVKNQANHKLWDLIIAHAVLDLLDLRVAIPQLLARLTDDGLFYFTLNFDGVTIFEPDIDPVFDEQLMHAYHQTMDNRIIDGQNAGESRTGRRMLTLLPQLGADILAAGASDWVVFPQQGNYLADEAYFLHFIIDTVYGALKDDENIDDKQLSKWRQARHTQIDTGKLIYIAHQIDICGKRAL